MWIASSLGDPGSWGSRYGGAGSRVRPARHHWHSLSGSYKSQPCIYMTLGKSVSYVLYYRHLALFTIVRSKGQREEGLVKYM